jgi:hypothetical protein
VSFKTTNLIESVMARLEPRTKRVTRWQTGDQRLRWCGAAQWVVEAQFRRVKYHRHLPLLQAALRAKIMTTAAEGREPPVMRHRLLFNSTQDIPRGRVSSRDAVQSVGDQSTTQRSREILLLMVDRCR